MSNLIHNERVKLHATFLNNIGVASVPWEDFCVFFRSRKITQYP